MPRNSLVLWRGKPSGPLKREQPTRPLSLRNPFTITRIPLVSSARENGAGAISSKNADPVANNSEGFIKLYFISSFRDAHQGEHFRSSMRVLGSNATEFVDGTELT